MGKIEFVESLETEVGRCYKHLRHSSAPQAERKRDVRLVDKSERFEQVKAFLSHGFSPQEIADLLSLEVANDLSMARARELSCISTTADGACREADAICAGPYLARAWPFLQRDWKAPGSRRANRAAMAWTRVCSLQPASTKAAKLSRSLRSLSSLSLAAGRTISLAAVSRNSATRFFWLTQQVYRFVRPLRPESVSLPAPSVTDHVSVQQAIWLLVRPHADLKADERADLSELCQASQELVALHQLAQSFGQIVRNCISISERRMAASAVSISLGLMP